MHTGATMTRHERLSAILSMIVEEGTVHIDDITEQLGVSAATARRDLDLLAEPTPHHERRVTVHFTTQIGTTREFNRRILRWEPETIVQLPAGIEVLDFMVPGSQTLMENSVRALRDHVIVLWSKHGIMVRSDASPLAAVDKVEYAETGAMYEVRDMMAGGLGQGVTDDELRAVVEAFEVPTDLL